MENNLKFKIQGVVAQAWCTKENQYKEMDADLANAVVDKLLEWLNKQQVVFFNPIDRKWDTYNYNAQEQGILKLRKTKRAYLVNTETIE